MIPFRSIDVFQFVRELFPSPSTRTPLVKWILIVRPRPSLMTCGILKFSGLIRRTGLQSLHLHHYLIPPPRLCRFRPFVCSLNVSFELIWKGSETFWPGLLQVERLGVLCVAFQLTETVGVFRGRLLRTFRLLLDHCVLAFGIRVLLKVRFSCRGGFFDEIYPERLTSSIP